MSTATQVWKVTYNRDSNITGVGRSSKVIADPTWEAHGTAFGVDRVTAHLHAADQQDALRRFWDMAASHIEIMRLIHEGESGW